MAFLKSSNTHTRACTHRVVHLLACFLLPSLTPSLPHSLPHSLPPSLLLTHSPTFIEQIKQRNIICCLKV